MPNTIAHLGIHSLITRGVMSDADFKWIFVGAVIPDFPFIIKRAITYLPLDVDILDVRLFSIVQASLVFSVLLALLCAQFSSRSRRVFLILLIGVVTHLLLDACQIKWGNGPRMLAPFDWSITNFDLFWPEELPSHLLTAFGVATMVYVSLRPIDEQAYDLIVPDSRRWAVIGILMISYLALPLMFIDDVERYGGGSVDTIRLADRTGHEILLDRARFRNDIAGYSVELFSGQFVDFRGIERDLPEQGKISVKGVFTSHDLITAQEYHFNNARFREAISLAGLAVILFYWSRIVYVRMRQRTDSIVGTAND